MSVQFRACSLLNSAKRESEIELLQILLLPDGDLAARRDDRDSLLSHAGALEANSLAERLCVKSPIY